MQYDPNSLDSKLTQVLETLNDLSKDVVALKADVADMKTQILSAKMIAKVGRSILLTIGFILAFKFGDISRLWK